MKYLVNLKLFNKLCLLEKCCFIVKNNFVFVYYLFKLCFIFKVNKFLCRLIVYSLNVCDFVNIVIVDGICSDYCW